MSWNTTQNFSYCELHQPQNPYCGELGAGEYVEVVCVLIIALFGTLGNLLVIFSVIFDGRVNQHGNIFAINLAVADLFVCGFFLPTVIANVLTADNALPIKVCQVAGYLVTVTCACSVCNLAFIALNRYWSVVRHHSYSKVFSKRNNALMVAFTWLWSNLIILPTLVGPSNLIYDYKMAECGWDDQASLAYNIALIICAIFIPVTVIFFCYWSLFRVVRSSSKRVLMHSEREATPVTLQQERTRLRKEITLLRTLAVTVVAFVVCWMSYGVVVMFFAPTVPPRVKKAAAHLGLSNSAMNFVIYGILNPIYRKSYKKFLSRFCCCKTAKTWLLREDPVKLRQSIYTVAVNGRPISKKTYIPSPQDISAASKRIRDNSKRQREIEQSGNKRASGDFDYAIVAGIEIKKLKPKMLRAQSASAIIVTNSNRESLGRHQKNMRTFKSHPKRSESATGNAKDS